MTYREILTEIHNRQLRTFCSVTDFRKREHVQNLPRKHRGLYWIWTNLPIDDLRTIINRPNTKEVPISRLVSQRQGLTNICKIGRDDFTIIYNGIGGYGTERPNSGLRERINQELNCNDRRTGTLNLLNRQNQGNTVTIENWGISFFDFDNPVNADILRHLTFIRNEYLDNAKDLEIHWRIEYGTPLLTRH